MDNVVSNCNGKNLLFGNDDIDYSVISEDEQQLTCYLKHNELPTKFTITFFLQSLLSQRTIVAQDDPRVSVEGQTLVNRE